MRFVVDAQLPPALIGFLEERGHVAEHVYYCFPPNASDESIWRHANAIESIIISKDEDFYILATTHTAGPPLLWIRFGNTSKRALFAGLTKVWADVEVALNRGDRIVEVV